jgi:hypothetical protein
MSLFASSPEEQPVKKTTVANDPEKRYCKGRPINQAQMDERVNAAYMLMLGGGSRRENAQVLATRYGVSHRQGENYIQQANQLMKTDFVGQKEELLNQVNNMRMHTVKKALKRGNFQVVAHLLDSLAKGAGEGSVEATAAQAPTLNITIDSKRNDAALEPSEAIQMPEPEPIQASGVEAIQDASVVGD